MKKNNNKNIYIIIIIFIVFLISLSIYYFSSYLPKQEILSLQKDCMLLGRSKSGEYKKDQNNDSLNEIRTDDYIFDESSKMCVYKQLFIYTNELGSLTEKYMYNLFTNKKLASYLENQKGYIINGNKYEYEQLENKYFK